jgi:glycerophosphoryl diester phosphodiesterase
VADAHAQGLLVHGWTFRAENYFLPRRFRSSSARARRGNLGAELAAYLAAGLDGFFTDQPDLGVRGRDTYLAMR